MNSYTLFFLMYSVCNGDVLERVGGIEPHSAQLGRLASHLELTRLNTCMITRDFVFNNGAGHVHLSLNPDRTVCYIYVYDIYSDELAMRFFTDVEQARAWLGQF